MGLKVVEASRLLYICCRKNTFSKSIIAVTGIYFGQTLQNCSYLMACGNCSTAWQIWYRIFPNALIISTINVPRCSFDTRRSNETLFRRQKIIMSPFDSALLWDQAVIWEQAPKRENTVCSGVFPLLYSSKEWNAPTRQQCLPIFLLLLRLNRNFMDFFETCYEWSALLYLLWVQLLSDSMDCNPPSKLQLICRCMQVRVPPASTIVRCWYL